MVPESDVICSKCIFPLKAGAQKIGAIFMYSDFASLIYFKLIVFKICYPKYLNIHGPLNLIAILSCPFNGTVETTSSRCLWHYVADLKKEKNPNPD